MTNEQIEKELKGAKDIKTMFDILIKNFELENARPSMFIKSIIVSYLWTTLKNLGVKRR